MKLSNSIDLVCLKKFNINEIKLVINFITRSIVIY